ncbi:T9SS type A sorting domain-containing protein [Hymenobacter busanensis]|nr:T9SS type A sorting domain-containing protein [Hymenobacter busanensis]QHJ06022.1 T9SS type A sorting domain-containing protein [Hymenobacter busanensis]
MFYEIDSTSAHPCHSLHHCRVGGSGTGPTLPDQRFAHCQPVQCPRNAPVTLSFSQALSAGSNAALHVFSAQRGGLRSGHSGITTVNGNQLSFAPASPWKPGETVRATLTTAVQNTSSQALAAARVFSFTAAAGGTGQGSFTNEYTFSAGGYPNQIKLTDVDGDGDLDMLSSNSTYYGGNPVSVRLNNGAGQFSGSTDVPVASVQQGAYCLTLGDVDGDGDIDFITTNTTDKVSLRLNNGTGGYGAGYDLTLNTSSLTSLDLADIDGDGDLDCLAYGYLLPSRESVLSVRLNNGTGLFAGGYTDTYSVPQGNEGGTIRTADLDNDGDLDLVRTSRNGYRVFIQLNDGTGRFGAPAQLPALAGNDVSLADLDGDTDLDLVVLDDNGLGRLTVCLNNGAGTFTQGFATSFLGNPPGFSLGDIDADGDLDLLVTSGASISVHFNNGQGRFPTYYRLTDTRLGNFALGDVDGDDDLDLVVEYWPAIPPTPPCPVYTYLNQAVAPVVVTNSLQVDALTKKVALYPNPAQQRCTVAFTKPLQNGQLHLVNALGQTVLRQQLPAAGARTAELDLANVVPGVYTLQVSSSTGRIVTRLVKE